MVVLQRSPEVEDVELGSDLLFSRRSFRTMDFISRRPFSSLLLRTSWRTWERVSLGGLETSEATRFRIGLTPIPSVWRRKTDETTRSSSSSPTQGTASKKSRHDSMQLLNPSCSATYN